MTFSPISYQDFSISDTSQRKVVPVGNLRSAYVYAEQAGSAWGTAVLSVKHGPTSNGPFIEFSPSIRLGPPASGQLAACSPLLDLEAVGFLEIANTAGESGEVIRVHVGGDAP